MIPLDNSLLRDVGAISRIIQFTSDNVFKRFKLQKGQFMFLTRICENPGIGMGHLANMIHVDKTTATKAVQKLERQNYVSRGGDPGDKRSVFLYPTALALQVYDNVLGQENEYLEICFSGMTQNDIAQLNRLVGNVRANLEGVWQSLK